MPRNRRFRAPRARASGATLGYGTQRAGNVNMMNKIATMKAQAVVDKSMETKVAVYQSPMIYVQQDLWTTGVKQILPNIPHGVNSWERTGQKVRLTKLVIRGHIYQNFTGGAVTGTVGNPVTTEKLRFLTRRFILKDKEHNDYRNVTSADLDFLLEEPAAVGQPYNGSTFAHNTPVNRGKFTVKKDERKMITSSIASQVTAEGLVPLYPTENNIHFFTDTIEFGGAGLELLFDGSNHPINFPFFMGVGYATPNSTAAAGDIYMQYTATAYYKD